MENAFAQHYSVVVQILWQASGAEPQGDYNSAASDGLKCTMRGVAQETEKSLTGVWMAGRAFCLVCARHSFSQMGVCGAGWLNTWPGERNGSDIGFVYGGWRICVEKRITSTRS